MITESVRDEWGRTPLNTMLAFLETLKSSLCITSLISRDAMVVEVTVAATDEADAVVTEEVAAAPVRIATEDCRVAIYIAMVSCVRSIWLRRIKYCIIRSSQFCSRIASWRAESSIFVSNAVLVSRASLNNCSRRRFISSFGGPGFTSTPATINSTAMT